MGKDYSQSMVVACVTMGGRRTRWVWFCAALSALVLASCRGPEPASAAKDKETAQVHALFAEGIFDLDAAAAAAAKAAQLATEQSGKASGEAAQAWTDVKDLLEDAGASLTEASVEVPSPEQFDAEFARFDELRLKAIELAGDAVSGLRDAGGLARELPGGALVAPEIEEAISAAADGIVKLGGKVPDSEGA
jgi:hypothetical protein